MKRLCKPTNVKSGNDDGAPETARRNFLKAAPLAGLALCLPQDQAVSSAGNDQAAASKHEPVYRLTDSIRSYYDRARF